MDEKASRAPLHYELRHQAPSLSATTAPAWKAAIKWRKATILTWASAVTLPVAASLYFFLPPGFEASVEVLLPIAATPAEAPKISTSHTVDTFIDGQIKMLASDHTLQKVIDRFDLWHDPEISEHSSLLGRLLADDSAPPESGDAHRSTRIDALRQRLDIVSLMPAPAMRVSYTSADPVRAAAVATAVAEAYIETVTAEARREAQLAETQLEQRLTRLQERLAAAASERPAQENDPNARRRQLEAAIGASLYGSTLAQYAGVSQARSLASSEPHIVKAAVPSRDDSAFRLSVLVLAFGVGGLIGLGAAIRREVISHPVRSAGDLDASLGVPTLGSITLVSGRKLLPKRARARPLLLHDDQDYLRALLLRLRRASNGGEALILGITSAAPGEGKSTIAFNLAVLAAENGERALLADMDLHNSTLTNALTDEDEGHLLEVVDGRRELQDAVAGAEQGFDVLGERTLDDGVRPVSVVGSQKMDATLSRARSLYDIVICDLPPVLDRADVSAMSHALDCFVFVAEWGQTPAPALERASQHLSLMESRLLGAVLNKVPPRS